MSAHRLSLLLAAAAAALLLSACSSTNKGGYYDRDGPPEDSGVLSTESATPRVEKFRPASLRPYTVMGKRYVPITTDSAIEQVGIGSWYGKQFHGNKTAIGEIYNMHAMTAAHPTMPLPSYARVTNLENGRSVIVRVNDRGPYLFNRIIDLSYAAASALGYANKGTAKVRVVRLTNAQIASGSWRGSGSTGIAETETASASQSSGTEYVTPASPVVVTAGADTALSQPASGWSVQIGFFSSETNARAYGAHAEAVLASESQPKSARIVRDNGGYRVLIGQGMSLEGARDSALSLRDVLGVGAFAVAK
ncbi:MAG: Endolytic peptidoglycan transglycosylase RlpA [Burkholderia sp.]|jgi:rare lipoprotein A